MAILANFSSIDEVIIPSYNSSAATCTRCGTVPVFVEINSYDMNISKKYKAINPKTKGIILTHYADYLPD